MIVKCVCTNCSGHLEFEEENAGEQITCPHCGWETTLYDDRLMQPDQELAGIRGKLRRHRRTLYLAGAAVAVLAVLGFAASRWVFPLIQRVFPFAEGTLMTGFILVGLIWVVLSALVWTVFPVVLVLQLKELTAILSRMEVHSRPAPDEQIEAAAEDELGESAPPADLEGV